MVVVVSRLSRLQKLEFFYCFGFIEWTYIFDHWRISNQHAFISVGPSVAHCSGDLYNWKNICKGSRNRCKGLYVFLPSWNHNVISLKAMFRRKTLSETLVLFFFFFRKLIFASSFTYAHLFTNICMWLCLV